ncbi:MAG TPA: 23S rRNA (guanosine(2251)-2'-O)-methyltransferase RlmB [Candidatus Polarisedimenticolia bacterium]|nr:23S rRNA (guanosine(2251)-2'-O)-methyltransferase RlmB [Candidatus Polarisedimenticolia bacterium]
MSDRLLGPHAVLEAIRARPESVTRVVIQAGRQDEKVRAILEAARVAGLAVLRQPRQALDRLAGGGTHQGVVAIAAETAYADPEEILKRAADRVPLLVVLDGVEDPRNLGAVIRSAAAAGADGLFLPVHGAVGLTAAALRTAAGAAERLPVARVGNIVSFLKELKERGIWVVGLDPQGGRAWTEFDMRMPLALVLGAEGKGLRRLALETCDERLSIPLSEGVESLNLAVAAGIVLFEAVRQRRGLLDGAQARSTKSEKCRGGG